MTPLLRSSPSPSAALLLTAVSTLPRAAPGHSNVGRLPMRDVGIDVDDGTSWSDETT